MRAAHIALAAGCVLLPGAATAQPEAVSGVVDWRSDWAVEAGYALEIDTEGYRFPTAIAFVPEPGPAPGDPLYFVTEIGGRIVVVTNDRTTHTFAEDFFPIQPAGVLPASEGQLGLAGLCLDPERGFVFATFAWTDSLGMHRNDVARFETAPATFAVRPANVTRFTHVFSADRSATSHQIGPCQVQGDALYVSVGDGRRSIEAQNPGSTLGKILRLTPDGAPHPDNPFRDASDPGATRNGVWALGLRNPFGLRIAEGDVFVADSGPTADRFLRLHAGMNALWDGTDWSIGLNADAVLFPSPSPVQMDFLPAEANRFPAAWRGRFFMATAGATNRQGPDTRRGGKGIVALNYDFTQRRVTETPSVVLRYRGHGTQSVVGLAFGPDALYLVPLFPQNDGRSVVLRLRPAEPGREHPFRVSDHELPWPAIAEHGCLGCHSVDDQRHSDVGPALDRDSLLARQLPRLGTVDSVRAWIARKIANPRFEKPDALMPDLGIPPREAALIADHLLAGAEPATRVRSSIASIVQRVIPQPRYRHIAGAFALGALAMAGALFLFRLRRRDPEQETAGDR